MGLFQELLEQKSHDISKKLISRKKTILLLSRSNAYLTTIIREIDSIFKHERDSVSNDNLGLNDKVYTDDSNNNSSDKVKLQVYRGTVGFFTFECAVMRLDVYTVSSIFKGEICNTLLQGVKENITVYFVIDGYQIHKELESNIAGGCKINNSVSDLLKAWHNDLDQVMKIKQVGGFGFLVGGYDCIEYNFKTMKVIDLVQQIVRMITIEENKRLEISDGAVAYLRNSGADADRIAELLGIDGTEVNKKIEIKDYSSMFVPLRCDDKESIQLVDDSFDYAYWANQWSIIQKSDHPDKKANDSLEANKSDTSDDVSQMIFKHHQSFLKKELNRMKTSRNGARVNKVGPSR